MPDSNLRRAREMEPSVPNAPDGSGERHTADNKGGLFLFEVAHALPSTFYMYGLPFYASARLGWGDAQNLLAQALAGFAVTVGAYIGGQWAHRRHPRLPMRVGLLLGAVGALAGLGGTIPGAASVAGALLMLGLATVSFAQALVWPALEAALMDGEPPLRVQNLVGYYNLTWSLATATAFLIATPLFHWLGLNTLFALPALFYLGNSALLARALPKTLPAPEAHRISERETSPPDTPHPTPFPLGERQRAAFRWLGWLANPFAYVAINVIVSYNPTLRTRLGLDFAWASLWFGLWFYVRTLTFEALRRWTWWQYRWRFLCAAFVLMMASFAAIVLAPNWQTLLLAQVAFGVTTGLVYQSSLFYAMAGSDAQGAHGGLHESFVGIGIMVGPLLAYIGTRLFPAGSPLPIVLVIALMGVGLIGLLAIGKRLESL